MHFVRKLSNKTILIRAAALAAAGSGTFCFATSSDHNASISVSMPLPFRDSLAWPWRTIEGSGPFSSFMLSNHSQHGLLPVSFSIPDVVPDPNISEGAALDAGDSPKHSCNCLGRDTIANAAAKIGPAVVIQQICVIHKFVLLVQVTLQDGRSFEGTVANADLHADIAIVKIKSNTPLPTPKLGTSSKLRPGDWVVAVGCPHTFQNTVTAGIVSCVDRKASDMGLGGMYREYLQTDCATNPGNSGGPLANADGEIVGVNFMKWFGADGLNFSVPIDSVSQIIEHFERNGRVIRPWLGLKMIDLNDMIVAHLKEKGASFPDVRSGVLITRVSPDSPASRAGFHPGDVLVEFGGRPIGSIKEVTDIMSDKVGQPFKAVVKRSNNVIETLTVIPEEANLELCSPPF